MLHARTGENPCRVDLVFPHLKDVQVDSLTEVEDGVVVTARTQTTSAVCHQCGTPAARRHSRYRRRLHDLAAGGRPVVIVLEVSRFFCDNTACERRTFAEQVPVVTRRHGRRTALLHRLLERLGLALAGRAGARLAGMIGLRASRSTLIRLVQALPDPPVGLVRVLGVDDFATRRGHVYGTVLIDMDTHRPIDLLPDRQAETLAAWLAEHPGIEVICRDRAGAYAEGARNGAPNAIQCADRWHLWHNLIQAIERSVSRHRSCLRDPHPEPEPAPPIPEPKGSTKFVERTRAKHARIHELKDAGHGIRSIARQLGMSSGTVLRYARAEIADELLWGQWTTKPSKVDDYKPYLRQRWNQGERNATRLLEEITAMGYRGSYGALSACLRPWRVPGPVTAAAPSARRVTGWIATRPERLDEQQRLQLKAILTRCPELDALARHVRDFAVILTQRQGQDLPAWIAGVRADDLPSLHGFATGLERDLDAVTTGLTLSWNSGPVEGHVNRIKMLKRQMFGRAGFPLLRARVLNAH
ncbi:ISL3 family transposase [Actinomadura sp. B10D3]|uniref:ISL3 family transposase n=1 Tax=Actinomadura sp. B10D3 TaxID=3153557 RepID=UPI00325DD809